MSIFVTRWTKVVVFASNAELYLITEGELLYKNGNLYFLRVITQLVRVKLLFTSQATQIRVQ